jgi:hypothetical protein
MQYYIMYDLSTGRPVWLWRVELDDEAETIFSAEWDPKASEWADSDQIIGYLMSGDVRVEAVSEAEARRFRPLAVP